MLVPSKSSLEFLAQATRQYQRAMRGSPAEEYLMSRGLQPDSLRSFRLGYVADSMPGHEKYRGRLAIPYLNPDLMTLQIRFRRIGDGNGPKYLTVTGDTPRPYNTRALEIPSSCMCVCEGELDAITATQAGLPAIGIPGVKAWRKEWRLALDQYDVVYILADNDPLQKRANCRECADKGADECQGHNVGNEFAETLAAQMENARIILMDEGHDVNSFVQEHGPEALRRKVGIRD
ncbi:hypothetical protein [Microtetraspora malaysiensis]|uniref:hypothetical protein n=1 Tax=Microtetraspora malaysiensis TaxID=161358 RepID=UPI003D906E35